MPVHPKFDFPGEQAAQDARTALESRCRKVHCLFNAAGRRGNVPESFANCPGELNVQAIFLPGKMRL